MKKINLTFDGYWREIKKNGIPIKSGIYCVYSCTYNSTENTVSINKLLYIGESENVHDRIANHDRLEDWKNELCANETLCYSFAPINGDYRIRAEAALIFKHKPPMNEEYVNNFPYNDTEILLSGKTALLTTNFLVKNTTNR